MSLNLQQFRDALVAGGLLSVDDLEQFEQSLPGGETIADAQSLARLLVAHRRLTKYQAAHVYQQNPLPLVFGNYVIQQKIAAGGMGRVYKAHHRRLDRLAAIKLLPKEVMNSDDAIRRFQQEVKAAARLTHQNIVITYDADEQDGIHYLVMEYVPGKDLANIVRKEGPLPVELAVECIRQAAAGLAYAHERGIIHRDIKPSNLLLAREAQSDATGSALRAPHSARVKILDMGLARIFSAFDEVDGEGSGLTRTGQIMGSVDYMSPEQAMDTRAADERSDIYSLGCTLYVLLTGKIPYYAKGLMKRLKAHRQQPTPRASDLRSEVPAELADVCGRMMAKDPAERPQSMAAVGRLLENCLQLDAAHSTAATVPIPPPPRQQYGSGEIPAPPPRRNSPPVAPPPPISDSNVAPPSATPSSAHDSNIAGNTLVSGIADPTAMPARRRRPAAPIDAEDSTSATAWVLYAAIGVAVLCVAVCLLIGLLLMFSFMMGAADGPRHDSIATAWALSYREHEGSLRTPEIRPAPLVGMSRVRA